MTKKALIASIMVLIVGAFSLIATQASAQSDKCETRTKKEAGYESRSGKYSRIMDNTGSRIRQKIKKIKENTKKNKINSKTVAAEKPEEMPVSSSSAGVVPAKNSSSPAPVNEADALPKGYKSVMTTIFWVGEGATASNDYISNAMSYWDGNWMKNYGGVDSHSDRCGYKPCSFTPKQNPFYFALPYGERDPNGGLRENVKQIPWYGQLESGEQILKNRWIEVKYGDKICYAQWEDVGPGPTDDFNYVFGDSAPKNTFGVKAGLDVSPAVWDCLGMRDNAVTSWRFVEESQVPEGPWKEIVTRN